MTENGKVIAVVVTYNRKELLIECLHAILCQTCVVERILLIDNASTDGTKDLLLKKGYLANNKIEYILMDNNTGGAGGFYEGIRRAREMEGDWIWLMDDDTIPLEDCLEKLMDAKQLIAAKQTRPIAFLSSTVYGPQGEFMNIPQISEKPSSNGYPYWYMYLREGIVGISNATFVSVLINKEAILQCGLPCRDYFIWGDDWEYTLRLSTYYGEGYFIGNSTAIHKRTNAKALKLNHEVDPKRIEMYHYMYRNPMINRHYYNDNYRGAFMEMIKALLEAGKYIRLKPYGGKMAKAVIKGSWEGIVQYGKFKKYIDEQLEKVLCSHEQIIL